MDDTSTSVSKPTAREFLHVLVADWASLVSGGLSVPFTVLALFLGNQYAKVLFATLAALGVLTAAYRIWANERSRHLEALSVLRHQMIEKTNRQKVREALQQFKDGKTLPQKTIRRLHDSGLIMAQNVGSMDTPVGKTELLAIELTPSGHRLLDGED
jgi:hypothetical protein